MALETPGAWNQYVNSYARDKRRRADERYMDSQQRMGMAMVGIELVKLVRNIRETSIARQIKAAPLDPDTLQPMYKLNETEYDKFGSGWLPFGKKPKLGKVGGALKDYIWHPGITTPDAEGNYPVAPPVDEVTPVDEVVPPVDDDIYGLSMEELQEHAALGDGAVTDIIKRQKLLEFQKDPTFKISSAQSQPPIDPTQDGMPTLEEFDAMNSWDRHVTMNDLDPRLLGGGRPDDWGEQMTDFYNISTLDPGAGRMIEPLSVVDHVFGDPGEQSNWENQRYATDALYETEAQGPMPMMDPIVVQALKKTEVVEEKPKLRKMTKREISDSDRSNKELIDSGFMVPVDQPDVPTEKITVPEPKLIVPNSTKSARTKILERELGFDSTIYTQQILDDFGPNSAKTMIVEEDLKALKNGDAEIKAEDLKLAKELEAGWNEKSNLENINKSAEEYAKNPFTGENADYIDPTLLKDADNELKNVIEESIQRKGVLLNNPIKNTSKALSILGNINTITDDELELEDVSAGVELGGTAIDAGKKLSTMLVKEGAEELTEEMVEEMAEEGTKDALGNVAPVIGIVTGGADALNEDLSAGERVGGALNAGADVFALYAAGSPEPISKTAAAIIYGGLKVASIASNMIGGAQTRQKDIETYGGSPELYAGDINWENIGYNTKMNRHYG